MDALITGVSSAVTGILAQGTAFSAWAIADPLVQFGLAFTVIGVVSGLILKMFHRA